MKLSLSVLLGVISSRRANSVRHFTDGLLLSHEEGVQRTRELASSPESFRKMALKKCVLAIQGLQT
ncbi:MAG: hypothetical protein KVP17_003702 [Porospora cf. gigantea B]|nr:MAG: hypothetical protein KVP17_003702 [Porospora cf. gigantea B]